MDDSAGLRPEPPTRNTTPSSRRRRNSIATSVVIPTKLSHLASYKPLHSSNSLPQQNGVEPPQLDLDLVSGSLKSSLAYTSLKDLIPSSSAAIGSPTAAAPANSGYEISIRNHLVKQAAWAYLQPMSASPGSSGPTHFLRSLCLRLSASLSACFAYLTHLLQRILHAFRVPMSR